MPHPRNTIFLRGVRSDKYEEGRAAIAVKPGMLCRWDADGKVRPHDVRGGVSGRMFAIEDSLRGKDPHVDTARTGMITDTYAIGDLVRLQIFYRGDVGQFLLHGGENVNPGDYLISYGDGTLCKAAAAYLANVVADSTTVTNTTAETTFSNATITIQNDTLKVGDAIRIRGSIAYPSTNATDTAQIKVKLGATTLITSAAVDVADNDECTFDVTVIIRTIGASGTFVAFGTIINKGTVTTDTVGSTAIDTTADINVTVTVTWSVASTANQAVLKSLSVEHVKAQTAGGNAPTGMGDIVGQVDEVAVDLSLETDPDWVCVLVM